MRGSLLIVSALLVGSLATPVVAEEGSSLPSFDAFSMVRGYFHAGSKIVDKVALGGFAHSGNYPLEGISRVPESRLSLIVLREEPKPFAGKFQGFQVILANGTGETIAFSASDSRLRIIREAIGIDGQWQPIEYLPSSSCGNSHHRLFLPSGQYWSFSAPVYQGSFHTRMRFTLLGSREREEIHSEEFEGFIHLEQFTKGPPPSRTSIMDPTVD